MLVNAGLTTATNRKLDDEQLLKDLHAYFSRRGSITTLRRFQADGPHSISVYLRRWGSWQNVIDRYKHWIDLDTVVLDSVTVVPNIQQSVPISPDRGTLKRVASSKAELIITGVQYGDFLNFRGLQHAPINELGVVFLFGMIARELGFVVEAVKPGFPDCEAKRQVGKGRWQRARIEFEFQSRNFRDHGHREEGCDLIVCWEHNWPECSISVLELRSALKSLSGE